MIARFKRFPAKDCETFDVVRLKQLKYLVLCFSDKRLTSVKVPRFRLETARAVMRTARDEQRNPDARAVCDITGPYERIVHRALLKISC